MINSIIAIVSLWLNKTACANIHRLLRCQSKFVLRKSTLYSWKTMSDDLDRHGRFHIISVLAPRWNCHALLARISPIWIDKSLTLELSGFGSPAYSWSLVLYDDSLKMKEWIGSTTNEKETVTWRLPPAIYSLSLRYYTDSDDIEVPTVVIDGSIRVVGGTIRAEATRYRRHLEAIRNRSGSIFRLLQFHVFYDLSRMEKCADLLRRQFLPMGNPDTEWNYGHLAIGERLKINSSYAHQRAYKVYVCFYNWASFPVDWYTVDSLHWCGDAFDQPVAYAIRRVRKKTFDALENSDVGFEEFVVTSVGKSTASRQA
jgi:hypothetical protein